MKLLGAFTFDKATAQKFVDALRNGRAIEPSDPAGWTGNDFVILAGVLHCYMLSAASGRYESPEKLSKEFIEALDEDSRAGKAKMIEVASDLVLLLAGDHYADIVSVGVRRHDTGEIIATVEPA